MPNIANCVVRWIQEEELRFCCCVFSLSSQKCVEILKHLIMSSIETKHIFTEAWGGFVLCFKIVCEKLLCLYCLERLLAQNNIVLFVSGKNCTIAEKICWILLPLYFVKCFYICFQSSCKFSYDTTCPLNVLSLFCIAIFVLCMTVELKPNKGASVVRRDICNTFNSLSFQSPL